MALLEARGVRKVYEGGDGQPIDVLAERRPERHPG